MSYKYGEVHISQATPKRKNGNMCITNYLHFFQACARN